MVDQLSRIVVRRPCQLVRRLIGRVVEPGDVPRTRAVVDRLQVVEAIIGVGLVGCATSVGTVAATIRDCTS